MSFERIYPKDEAEWLKLRTEVLTATDMGAVLGLNKWKSVSTMLKDKDDAQPFENAYTWTGQILEPVVVQAVNKVLGTDFKLFPKVFYADFDLGLGATPDAGNDSMLLECKTTKPGNALKYAAWPPTHYLCQLYIQLICTEMSSGLLAILSTNLTQTSDTLVLPLTIHKVQRTDKLDKIILKEVERLWTTIEAGKVFKVNRKLSSDIELLLQYNRKLIYE